MTIMFYFHGDTLAAETLEEEFEGLGITSKRTKCLCESPLEKDVKVAVIHPHDNFNYGCYARIRNTIETYPKVKFYLLAINATERIVAIGEHQNLEYLDRLTLAKYKRIAQEIRQIESQSQA